MKAIAVVILLTLSLSAMAEGTFDCHLKTGRRGAHAQEVAGSLVVTDAAIVFSTASEVTVFPTETREVKRWRMNSWIEYAIDQGDIRTRLAVDSEESMDKITIESMRGNTLVKVNTYLCFQTRY
jgi:hypothetical protein